MVHEALPTPRVSPPTTRRNGYPEDGLMVVLQILHTFPASSSDQGSAKLGKLAPSHTRPMSQLPTRHVNTLLRYAEPSQGSFDAMH